MQRIFRTLFSLAFTVIAGALFTYPAHALVLKPALVDITLQPNQATSTMLFVARDESGVGEYEARVLPFRPSNDGRSIEWLPEASSTPLRVTPETFRLLEGEAKALEVRLQGADAITNAFYGVMIQPIASSAQTLQARVASLFFLSSPKNVSPEFFVTALTMTETHGDVFSAPRSAQITVQNLGTGYGIPEASVVTRTMFGDIVSSVPLNPTRARVFAQGSRTFHVTWSSRAFGQYTTSIEGGNFQSALVERWWVIPTSVWAIFACLVIGIVLFLRRRRL